MGRQLIEEIITEPPEDWAAELSADYVPGHVQEDRLHPDTTAEFVIDTVGDIETPAGDRFRGVILALPVGLTPEQERDALRKIARLWAERVTLAPVQKEDAA